MSRNGTIEPDIVVRALIAEDERLIALAIRSGLESQGYQVVGIAGTGIEVLDLASSYAPHIILMDVRMPGMDGIDATRALMLTDPAACVVIVSGSREPEQIARAEQAGAMDYVIKPFEAYQMRPVLDRAQRRFARFLAIRGQTPDSQEALETWVVVRRAVKALLEAEGLSEQDAHNRLEQQAAQRGLSLRAMAEAALQAFEDEDE